MEKVGRPTGLIRWDTLAAQQAKETGAAAVPWRPVRARTLLYAALLSVVAAVMLVVFALRADTELTVQRDRNPNYVRLSNGDIRNSYAVKVLNKRRTPQHVRLEIDGLPSAQLGFVGADVDGSGPTATLSVQPDAVGTFRVFVTVPASAAPSGAKPITFTVRDEAGSGGASHDAVFVGPGR